MSEARSREETALRDAVIATARAMNASGLNRGRAGNVSARYRNDGFDGFLMTPSGVPYDTLTTPDIVAMRADGTVRDAGARVPSTEWHSHRALYAARPDAHAVVHAHSMFATTLACLKREIPAFHYMVARAGGNDIRCAEYATFGTDALAGSAVQALEGRKACLLAHHGLIALGADLAAALEVAAIVEELAEMYWRALQIGEPETLGDAEMHRVAANFADYDKSQMPK